MSLQECLIALLTARRSGLIQDRAGRNAPFAHFERDSPQRGSAPTPTIASQTLHSQVTPDHHRPDRVKPGPVVKKRRPAPKLRVRPARHSRPAFAGLGSENPRVSPVSIRFGARTRRLQQLGESCVELRKLWFYYNLAVRR